MKAEQDCFKELFEAVDITRRISEFIWQWVPDRRTSDWKSPTTVCVKLLLLSPSVCNSLLSVNHVSQLFAPSVLGWVTVCRRWTILVCNQPPRSTQPGHPSVCWYSLHRVCVGRTIQCYYWRTSRVCCLRCQLMQARLWYVLWRLPIHSRTFSRCHWMPTWPSNRLLRSMLFIGCAAVVLLRNTNINNSVFCVGLIDFYYAPQLYRQVLLRRVLATGILSVRPSVTTRYGFKARWDRDSGSSPYGSLEYLVSYELIWCQWVKRVPSNEGIKEGYPP